MERRGHEHGQRHANIDVSHHDWHSMQYVDEWIDKDVTRDEQRRPIIREMLSHAPFSPNDGLRVLDVGGGYGVLTEEVLKVFPNAHVTLQDYSEPMFKRARERLAQAGARVSFVERDFSKPAWTEGIGGPFDLAVSGIAIHNLANDESIRQVYRAVFSVLKPGGAFLDLDYVGRAGLDAHVQWLREAGFSDVQCPRMDGNEAMLVALRRD